MTIEADRNHVWPVSATGPRANRAWITRGFPGAGQLCLAALCVIALSMVSPAHADTVFSNVGTSIEFNGGGGIFGPGCCYIANAFAFTPTASYILTSAKIDIFTFYAGRDGRVTGSLYTSSGGTPGTLIAPLGVAIAPVYSSLPSLPFESLATTFAPASGPAVSVLAGTEYWLVLASEYPDGVAYYRTGGAAFFAPQSQVTGSAGNAWNSRQANNVQFEIDGSPLSSGAPEPATFFLFGSALTLAAAKRFTGRVRRVPTALRTRPTL